MTTDPDPLNLVLDHLILGDKASARLTLRERLPFERIEKKQRSYTPLQAMRVFLRDGFIDRYSGRRLVFPAALRLISLELPEEFPFHSNWKFSETHRAYWDLIPTIDHVLPVAVGGSDDETNWATTNMIHNSAKGLWTLDELGWEIHGPGNLDEWDGLASKTVEHTEMHGFPDGDTYIARWVKAYQKAKGAQAKPLAATN
ncbi:MAG TPA: HNH endonuclease [Acidimicrobiales bacterium]|nr:HNH endonuclease [Acidimicrobiales bacterium]